MPSIATSSQVSSCRGGVETSRDELELHAGLDSAKLSYRNSLANMPTLPHTCIKKPTLPPARCRTSAKNVCQMVEKAVTDVVGQAQLLATTAP